MLSLQRYCFFINRTNKNTTLHRDNKQKVPEVETLPGPFVDSKDAYYAMVIVGSRYTSCIV